MKAKTQNLDIMSAADLERNLKTFGRRALHLCGITADGQPLGPKVKAFFDDMLKNNADPEKIRMRNEFLARAEKDPIARQQLCAIRVETVSNYLIATLNILPMFFEVINLADDERPVVQYTTDQEIAVTFIGQDGGLTM